MPQTIMHTSFKVIKLKVKVARQITADTESVSYLPNRKAYELLTWYIDGELRPVSPTSAMTTNVKGQGFKVT